MKFTNFEIVGTGGNCSLLIVTLADGRALSMTDGDAYAAPAEDSYYFDLRATRADALEFGGSADGDDALLSVYHDGEDRPLSAALAHALGMDAGDVLHEMARDYMTWTGLESMSLDEFLVEHEMTLTDDQRRIGVALLGMFDVCADTFYTINRG